MAEEVSVRLLELPLKYLERRKIDATALVESIGLSADEPLDKRKRIDWAAFVSFNRGLSKLVGGPDALTPMGRELRSAAVYRQLKIIVRPVLAGLKLVARPSTFYRWISSNFSMLVSCVESTVEVTPWGLRCTISVAAGYEVSEEYFLIAKGTMEAIPSLLGYPLANVTMVREGPSTTYHVTLAPERRLLDIIANFFRRLQLGPMAAAAELESTQGLLEQEHRALKASNVIVQQQSRHIAIVEELGRTLVQEIDPSRVAGSVSNILLNRLGFKSIAYYTLSPTSGQLELATSSFDPPDLLRPQERGSKDLEGLAVLLAERNPNLLVRALRADASALGLIAGLPREEGTELSLFNSLLPHLTIAAKHSLAFATISDLNRGLERRVKERTLELTKAEAELTETVAKLREAEEARSRLFANLNHEFRTPLTVMLLPLEHMLSRGELTEAQRKQLEAVARNARRLLRLVNDLLLLAANREGRMKLEIEEVDLSQMVFDAVEAIRPAAEERRIHLNMTTPGEPMLLVGNPEGLERIVNNLVSNALKYTKEGGAIDVRVERSPSGVRLRVTDTGIGIRPEDQKRIFERFVRVDSPVAPGSTGTGIGLALVRELSEWHGGSVSVESERGVGSAFLVELPSRPTADVLRGLTLPRPERAPSSPPPSGSPTHAPEPMPPLDLSLAPVAGGPPVPLDKAPLVMVVEDHPELRARMCEILAGNFRSVEAVDGRQALELAVSALPDLVLADINMPVMDGLEFCRRFKHVPTNHLVPVILVTAASDKEMILRGFEAGADDFLVKPFDESELLARIRAQLRIRTLALRLAESGRMAAVGGILAGLAHELRNPINVLVNGIDPLRRVLSEGGPLQPGAGELLDAVEQAGGRVADLAKELLAFYRPTPEPRSRVAVPELVDSSLAMLRPKLAQVRIETDFNFSGEVVGSPYTLSQVVVNLIENAIHATNGKGTVGISTRRADHAVELEVWDNGPGIPTELRERIFEPFFSTKSPGEGTGLGLAICRQIAERYGGTLNLEPSASGARFRLTLPQEQA